MLFWVVSLSTMKLIPHSLTATLSLTGIRSLADVGKLVGPLDHPVALPPVSESAAVRRRGISFVVERETTQNSN